jgi:hypothetical protein
MQQNFKRDTKFVPLLQFTELLFNSSRIRNETEMLHISSDDHTHETFVILCFLEMFHSLRKTRMHL